MSFGNHPDAKGVFDLDSVQLIRAAADLNEGKFMSGDEVKPPTKLFIGGAANPFAEPFELRIIRLGKKIAAGARFIQTRSLTCPASRNGWRPSETRVTMSRPTFWPA